MVEEHYQLMAENIWFILPMIIVALGLCCVAEHYENKWK